VKRRHRRLLVVNVANGNSVVDDCVVLNVTPDTTTADVLHKVRSKLTYTIRYCMLFTDRFSGYDKATSRVHVFVRSAVRFQNIF